MESRQNHGGGFRAMYRFAYALGGFAKFVPLAILLA